jgi:mono/diheme cytochrome c family protein
MPRRTKRYEPDEDDLPTSPGELSTNGHWIFGSIFAALILLGFGFGVWAGASKPKPETADKPKDADRSVAQAPRAPAQPAAEPGGTSEAASEKNVKTDPPVTPTKPEPKVLTPPPKPAPKTEPKPEPKVTTPPKTDPKPTPEPKPPTPPKTDPKPPAKVIAFAEVKPILVGYCGNCHGQAGKPRAGVDLRTVAAIMKGGDNGDILKAGKPMESTLYTSMLPGASVAMPPDGKPGPNEKELKLIHDWIAGGAKPRRTVRRKKASAAK